MYSKPLAYFITVSCYGTRLHGDERGSVDRDHNAYRTDRLPAMESIAHFEESELAGEPYVMDLDRAVVALSGIRAACERRSWNLFAAHVRTTHVHSVAWAGCSPDEVFLAFKSYASRALNKQYPAERSVRRWSRHASAPYLWTFEDVAAAVRYVVEEQGQPMALYVNPAAECMLSGFAPRWAGRN